ncbi:MAG: hypothetical protein WBA12_13560 [Catalinimonas sp.]
MSRYLLIAMAFVWGCSSVRNDPPAVPDVMDSTAYEAAAPGSLVPSVNKAEMVLLPDAEGILRGHLLGDTRREVLASEPPNTFEQEENELLLTVDLDSTEFADITYRFDGEEYLRGIDVQVYLRNAASLTLTYDQFVELFNGRYGAARREDSTYVWSTPEFNQVRLMLINEGLDRGIDISIK